MFPTRVGQQHSNSAPGCGGCVDNTDTVLTSPLAESRGGHPRVLHLTQPWRSGMVIAIGEGQETHSRTVILLGKTFLEIGQF